MVRLCGIHDHFKSMHCELSGLVRIHNLGVSKKSHTDITPCKLAPQTHDFLITFLVVRSSCFLVLHHHETIVCPRLISCHKGFAWRQVGISAVKENFLAPSSATALALYPLEIKKLAVLGLHGRVTSDELQNSAYCKKAYGKVIC